MFSFNMESRLFAVFVVVCMLNTIRVTSQCTTRHCVDEVEAETIGLVFSTRQLLTKQEETILSMETTISAQQKQLHEFKTVMTADRKRYDKSLTQLQSEITAMKDAPETQNTSCCVAVEHLQHDVAALKDKWELAKGLRMNDCVDLLKEGFSTSGVYSIYLTQEYKFIQVYCDMTTDGGGWLVFQRRQDGSVEFNVDWNTYKKGFGDVSGEFWLGNDNLHSVTSSKRYELRVDMEFTNSSTRNRYASYSTVNIASESNKYKITLGTHSGTAVDKLRLKHNNMFFSTKDRDNDPVDFKHCAQEFKSGWWYEACMYAHLNAPYNNDVYGYRWSNVRNIYGVLVKDEMKLRPSR